MPPSPGFKPGEQSDWSQAPEAGAAPKSLAEGQPPRPLTGIGAAGKMRWHVITEGAGKKQPRLGPAQAGGRRQGAQGLPRNMLLILHPYPTPMLLAPHASKQLGEAGGPRESRGADNPQVL